MLTLKLLWSLFSIVDDLGFGMKQELKSIRKLLRIVISFEGVIYKQEVRTNTYLCKICELCDFIIFFLLSLPLF